MKCLCLCLLRFVSPRLLRIKKFVASKVLINITIKRRTSRVQFKAIPGASSSRVPRGTTPGGCMMDAPLSQLQSLVLPRHHHQPQHLMHLHHGPSLDAILPLHVEHPIWLACRSHFVLPNGQWYDNRHRCTTCISATLHSRTLLALWDESVLNLIRKSGIVTAQ